MNTPGAKAYRPWTPELYAHQAHAPSAKLPEDDLVFFLIDVVPKLDLSKIHAPYQDETREAPPLDPAMMVCFRPSIPIVSGSSPAQKSPAPASATWRSWPSSGRSRPIFAPLACSARPTSMPSPTCSYKSSAWRRWPAWSAWARSPSTGPRSRASRSQGQLWLHDPGSRPAAGRDQ